MYDTILLPTDGTAGTEGAIDHAIELAATYGATVHVLYVVDEEVYSAYSGDEYVAEGESLEHALEEAGRDAVERVVERATEANVETVSAIENGIPYETILSYGRDHDVDLTVMGTRERPPEYRQILGSVTRRVTQLSRRPVLVVKSGGDVEDGDA